MHASECWNGTIGLEDNFRIAIVRPTTVDCGILFVPPSVVVDIFVRTSTKSSSVRALKPGGRKLGGVVTASGFFECGIEHRRKLDYWCLLERFEDDVKYPERISWNSES
ncbi:unnamed protein product [Sphagnum tenellum]